MEHFKHFSLALLTGFFLIIYSVSAWSAGAIEYNALQDLIAKYPDQTATEHDQCNKIAITKSPLNKKSLNPMCQLCVSAQEDGLNTTYIALPVSAIDSGGGGASLAAVPENNNLLNACVAGTNQIFGNSFITDYSTFCASRGGDFGTLGSAVICSFTVPTAP